MTAGERFIPVFGLVFLTVPGCERSRDTPSAPAASALPEVRLVDATERLGVDFVHDCGPERTYFMPEIMGAGCAVLDYDNDGDLDLYFVNGAPAPDGATVSEARPNRLYRQETDGTFVDVTEASGAGDTGYGMGVAVGDYDNDGFVDLYVTNYGPNRLYRNRGDGTFEDVTDVAGVGHAAWGTSAAFVDIDRDGHLDLVVVNYVQYDPTVDCPDATGRPEYCGPERFPGAPDVLYRSRGDGTFEDVSRASGISGRGLRGLGVVCADFDADGWIDIYVANDNQANQLWMNRHDGTFVDDAILAGAAFNRDGSTEASMGLACEDFDADGDFDLLMTHLHGESHTMYRNDGAGAFEDVSSRAGLLGMSMPFTGFGIGALDLELDGDLDVVAVNGHVFRVPGAHVTPQGGFWNDYAQPGQVFLNHGAATFADISGRIGAFGETPWVGRGLALGDLDNDGDVDVVTTSCNGPAHIHLNESARLGNHLTVRAVDPHGGGGDAIGAVVTVRAGGRAWRRMVSPGASYLSSGDMRVHFGLGTAERVDEVDVRWPDGRAERFGATEVNTAVVLRRGAGVALEGAGDG